ncbi:hypothetical protein PENDEC_c016G07015 [Penicillium decumbens]|uniref:Crh-like protein n=1 Tax=Penicillium decumbens TaxID=69771 RepID=A0A1V6P850_PENDC|nr:hypothetical protein PENDEC_c016G07015 [Penicillium decumbens]
MRFTLSAALCLLSSSVLVAAQTYTDCNPTEKSCPADTALGASDQVYDFTSGASDQFSAVGSVTYDDTNGATFTVAKKGDGPLIQSGWYIMFGKVEFTIKAAPGTGIVSSAVLQSDDLDEIDWEWLGAKPSEVQTNYFGKGDTSSYSRGAFHANPDNQNEWHTYSVDWTSEQIVWAIDGKTVRALTPSTAATNQYPQSPMMIKVGVWAGGDSGNAQGTVDWAGGLTDYSQGPFNMYMKSMTVTDYSTGNSYSYGDKSGSWESIVSNGGKINGNRAEEPTETQAAPSITATASDIPIPWSGTHKETSTFVTPNVWPWVATDRPSTSTGLPSGWESASDRISPPGGSSMSEQPLAPRVNTSLELVTKTESSPQSTSQFTSVSWASSSAVSSPSGLETSGSATRLASSTSSKKIRTKTTKTSTKKTATKTTATKTTATKTDKAAYSSTPTVVSDGISLRVPTILDGFCALVGGILAFI